MSLAFLLSARRPGRSVVRLAAALVLAPAAALGAGSDVPENGAMPLARGGTTLGLAGTAYAAEFNPAGLAALEGLDVRVDARFVDAAISFRRAPTSELRFAEVANSAGIFTGPRVSVGWRPGGTGLARRFAFGGGVWGPAGVGHYRYPDAFELSRAGWGVKDAGEASGQRYSLIESKSTMLFPSVAAAVRATDRLWFGLTLQAAVASVGFSRALAAKSYVGTETPDLDAVIRLEVSDPFTPTLVAGAIWEPAAGLRLGFSLRPPVSLHAAGTLRAELSAAAASDYEVRGERAAALLTLPPVARAGASLARGRFTATMEVLFEGWSWYDRIVLDPQGVSVVNKEDGTTTTVGRLELVKGWRNSYGARLGGSFRWLEPGPARPGVELHAGLAGETNAVPLERQAIDAVGGDRLGGSLGATLSWRGLSLTLAAMQYLPVTLDVSGSLVTRTAVEPEPQPTVVGNGTYRASTRVLAVGLGWSGTAF